MKRTMIALLVAGIAGGVLFAEEVASVDFSKIKCPVSGKPVKEDATVDYKEHKVYLCCEGCPTAFKKDTAKFSAKANRQLVRTKQFEQVACPISGKPAKAEVSAKVGEMEVGMCCNGCKGKVDKAEADDKLALVFSDKAFEKGFKPVKKADAKN